MTGGTAFAEQGEFFLFAGGRSPDIEAVAPILATARS
jgi:3-hydroxyisobutyrate dehydrogenase-like beta-hydroxyacid dehydrogenase